jgi:hypothetical protein
VLVKNGGAACERDLANICIGPVSLSKSEISIRPVISFSPVREGDVRIVVRIFCN